MRALVFVLFAATLAAAGCSKKETPAGATTAAPTTPAPTAQGLTGTVAEAMDASNYTYLRLTTASGEVWAAIPVTQVKVGETVTIASPMRMENFESKSLGRTFDVIMFGGGLAGAGAGAPGALPAGHPTEPAAAPEAIAIERAPGGKTVAEIFAQKAALANQQVTLRAQVVKATSGVLGKTWLHVRDGTGAEGTDNDVTVTTTDRAAVGDVVTITATLRLDRDIGAGYAYPVLLEEATLAR